jgi:LacI family trehalose operon transcriptional repressor
VCATDTLALGASKYLQEQRIGHLQVASVGSTPLMKFLHPEILTVIPVTPRPVARRPNS